MIRAAVIGATGYTGSELVRILLRHPEAKIGIITSESRTGETFPQVHPQFEGLCDMTLRPADDLDEVEVDVCFLALPHRVSMEYVRRWRDREFRIIDLSGDYRLSSAGVYQEWYGKEHVTPDLVPEVPYGLPELERENLRGAQITANPGCYPTSAILGLAPLLAAGAVDPATLIVDAKSGVTGAGVKSSPVTHFSNVNENFKAYGLKTHRHTIEIEERLSGLGGGDARVQFTPHLLPVDRGILATCYATPRGEMSEEKLRELYREFYRDEPFIRIRETLPELKSVRGTNLCDIHAVYDGRSGRIIVLSAIDNLVKGAAGAAVQNMNVMWGLEERSGLEPMPLQP